MLEIRKVQKNELPIVRFFYACLIDEWKDSPYPMGWVKGIFPSESYLMTAVENGTLYAGIEENRCVAAMIVDHHSNRGYKELIWPQNVADEKVLIIHALGVTKAYIGRGYGNMMIEKALSIANEKQCVVMRSDVLEANHHMERLYRDMGFVYVGDMVKYYEEEGKTIFKLFEYTIG